MSASTMWKLNTLNVPHVESVYLGHYMDGDGVSITVLGKLIRNAEPME